MSRLSDLLIAAGGKIPETVRANRQMRSDEETEKLRRALLEGQISESDLNRQLAQKNLTAKDLENQKALEDAKREREARSKLGETLSSFGSQQRLSGAAKDIQGLEEQAGLTPLATEQSFQPKTMRETAMQTGLPGYAGQEDVEKFTKTYITDPETLEQTATAAEARISQKEKDLASREKIASERIDLQEKLAEARQLAADAAAAAKEGKDVFEKEYKITNQFNSLSKDYRTTRDAMQKINEASKLNNATGDMALIYGFMRMQDPTSTVREGEYATAEQARGIPQSVIAMYNKAIDGRRLSEDQRTQFANTARTQFAVMEKNQKTLEDQYTKIANDYGLNPERILGRTVRSGTADAGGEEQKIVPTTKPAITYKRVNGKLVRQ